MSKIAIVDGNGSWHFDASGMALDIGVNPNDGYHVFERQDENLLPVAHKLKHVIGKQVVTSPITGDQISETDLVREIEAVL
jgi:hypothetical protein